MGYKLGYHILVLPDQVLLINSVLTNEVLLYVFIKSGHTYIQYVCTYVFITETSIMKQKKVGSCVTPHYSYEQVWEQLVLCGYWRTGL